MKIKICFFSLPIVLRFVEAVDDDRAPFFSMSRVSFFFSQIIAPRNEKKTYK